MVGDANVNGQYAIHFDPGTANLTVRSVSISGNDRTGLDFNGVDGGLIEDVSSTGAASGYGIALSSCANITLQDITTSGNAWEMWAFIPRPPSSRRD